MGQTVTFRAYRYDDNGERVEIGSERVRLPDDADDLEVLEAWAKRQNADRADVTDEDGASLGRVVFRFEGEWERISPDAPSRTVDVEELERTVELLKEKLERELRRRRTVPVGIAGYNVTTRTPRMVLDKVKRDGVPLENKDRYELAAWNPNTLPLNARIVFLGLLNILNDTGMMPEIEPNRELTSLEPVLVVFNGWQELADACGYERDPKSGKHRSTHIKTMKAGLNNLVTDVRKMYHFWKELDRQSGKLIPRYSVNEGTIARKLSHGELARRSDGQIGLLPWAHYVGIDPFALLGARVNYRLVPSDLIQQYRHALDRLKGRTDKRTRRLIGARPRMSSVDLEFLLWCYMHRDPRRPYVDISDDKMMDRMGIKDHLPEELGGRRHPDTARKRLDRAIAVALEVGALVKVTKTVNGVPRYILVESNEEPHNLADGTLELPLETEGGPP